jgi:RimJ/RimL family protein N-acetyltransferase
MHLARIARGQGLEEFRAYVLAENRAMLEVFENAGFPLERRLEGNVIVATLGLGV